MGVLYSWEISPRATPLEDGHSQAFASRYGSRYIDTGCLGDIEYKATAESSSEKSVCVCGKGHVQVDFS